MFQGFCSVISLKINNLQRVLIGVLTIMNISYKLIG